MGSHDGNLYSRSSRLTVVDFPSIYVRVVKPVSDRIGGVILLILLSPILAISALAVLISIGRPVFYRQKRIGLNGIPFELYKLRTMLPDRRVSNMSYSGDDRRLVHKSKEDPRVLPVGAMLRSKRLDELPQLWNVVRGDMSLVGPRPEIPEIVDRYDEWQHRRHEVRPGLTGLWQVSELNGQPMHECTELDIEYLSRISFMTDLTILAKTPVAMFHRGGY